MRKKVTPKTTVDASALDIKTIIRLCDLATEIQINSEEAAFMAEMSLERMADNGLCDSKKVEAEIYFPPREREILRFICNDVEVRINALNELASNMVAALYELRKQMRNGEVV